MDRTRTRTALAVLAAVLPLGLVAAYAIAVPPTLIAWFSQPERVSAVAMQDGAPTIEQTLPAGERELDAVALVLPSDFGTLDGILRLSVDTGRPDDPATSRDAEVDLAAVHDWQIHVFRFAEPLGPGPRTYTLRTESEGRAYVAAGREAAIPDSALLADGRDTNSDLTVWLYDRVGWPEFLGHVSATSETRAPAWWIGGALLLAPVLLGLALWSLVMPVAPALVRPAPAADGAGVGAGD